MKPVRIAMLGSGFVADFYMQGLADVPDGELVVNYSRNAGHAEVFARKWAIPENTTNMEELIARDDLDLYIIALPNEEHLQTGLKLANARRNQVCTKPLARNGKEAGQLRDAAEASGALHGYAETEVFAPAVVKARQMIETGALGKVLWVRSREAHSGPHSTH
ncbi:MAG TPA: Gfo/Idh/MocA family oxidoreductase, partial [Acidobacteriaceae bacterium]|nr:Gfo/Idh/MocA family oxidoreductase [Acidobacteriaceae bacterium]